MKRFANILFILTIVSCNTSRIDNGLSVNEDLVSPFFRNGHLYPENPDYEFVEIAGHIIDLNNNGKLDTIKLRVIKDWTDPGDFHQIEIVLDNDKKIVETCFDGWVKFGENYTVNPELKSLNKIPSDLLLLTDFGSDRMLIFVFGWVYASTPGLMTVFDANGLSPKIVFNDNFDLKMINDNSFTGLFGYSEKNKTIKLINNRLETQ